MKVCTSKFERAHGFIFRNGRKKKWKVIKFPSLIRQEIPRRNQTFCSWDMFFFVTARFFNNLIGGFRLLTRFCYEPKTNLSLECIRQRCRYSRPFPAVSVILSTCLMILSFIDFRLSSIFLSIESKIYTGEKSNRL